MALTPSDFLTIITWNFCNIKNLMPAVFGVIKMSSRRFGYRKWSAMISEGFREMEKNANNFERTQGSLE